MQSHAPGLATAGGSAAVAGDGADGGRPRPHRRGRLERKHVVEDGIVQHVRFPCDMAHDTQSSVLVPLMVNNMIRCCASAAKHIPFQAVCANSAKPPHSMCRPSFIGIERPARLEAAHTVILTPQQEKGSQGSAPVLSEASERGREERRVLRMMPSARPRWNAILCIMNGCGSRPRDGGAAPATNAAFSCAASNRMLSISSTLRQSVLTTCASQLISDPGIKNSCCNKYVSCG